MSTSKPHAPKIHALVALRPGPAEAPVATRLSFGDLLRGRSSNGETVDPDGPHTRPAPPHISVLAGPVEAQINPSQTPPRTSSEGWTESSRGRNSFEEQPKEIYEPASREQLPCVERPDPTPRLTALSFNATRDPISTISRTIADFCNAPIVGDSEGWSVSLRLDAELLPETTMHVGLSQQRLLLRFQTLDQDTRLLLSTHQDALRTRLFEAVPHLRDIAINIQ
ncbi:type III secretion system protein SctP [Paucibacter sp. PLA-PC-4]|uniref:type III secretion system protein SctP n=1 Tax=Paucibacter sp. PLA-PC-4 TaxID=2993655 RepID=UPI003A4C6CED